MATKRVLKENTGLKEYDPIKELLDHQTLGAAIMECLMDNDTEGVLEIIEGYIYAVNRTQFLKHANVPRSTAYNMLKGRNPTLRTLAKIMHESKNY
jgi:DNA-binding phage protein